VRFVTLQELIFRHAARTVMDTKEPLLRTDWAIYRGGAILFEGVEDCALEDCFLDQVGGNACSSTTITAASPYAAVTSPEPGPGHLSCRRSPGGRNPLFNYSQVNRLEDLDRTPGRGRTITRRTALWRIA